MIEIDPQFRRMGKGARRRRQRMGALRGGALLLALAVAGTILWHRAGPQLMERLVRSDDDLSIVPVEGEFELAPIVRADTFTDIPGDPMIIPGAEGAARTGHRLSGPDDLAVTRVGNPSPERLTVVREDLHVRERRLVAALPTTREEFALFQAERSRERLFDASAPLPAPGFAPPADPDARQSSSIAFTREPAIRPALWQELILQVRLPTDIARLLRNNGFDETTAERVRDRLVSVMEVQPELPGSSLLALRYRVQADDARQVLQLSLYRGGEYVGSLGMGASGQLVPAADPWADQPLMSESASESVQGDTPQFRLLDVIYSAAIRQGVSSELIGEAIALMSRVHDLDAFAAEGDRLQLVFANQPGPGAQGAGQILFVGVTGPSGDKPCYVVPQREGGYDCHAPGARVAGAAGRPAMSVPVSGVLSRRFAPPSAQGEGGGVVWQAAQGSPVAAVAAGRIADLREGGDGLELRIDHADGFVSLYRGLEDPPPAIRRGAEVKPGTVIGRVAAQDDVTGLSVQLLKDGAALDPIPLMTGGSEVLASNAVEALIGRIIHVESAGNPTARNPLSTATGLGQFIESTWLRMMRTYRPDLVATMDRRQLLDLRLDPDLSRQMVRSLAQENEAFLRARGHPTTPGNLYLAHFLGPMGASQALAADPSRPVGEVMGAAVVSANPFLRNYTIGDLRAWSDRKMNAQAVSAASVPVAAPVRASPEVERFVALMDGILAEGGG